MTKPPTTSAKAQTRKAQVLDAAAGCFQREGFHRSSIAQISAASGMSSGHIYHYFGSKEGIIEAIAAREHSELGRLIDNVKVASEQGDVVSAIVSETAKSVDRYLDSNNASLVMEILAEASRNPEIASLVQNNDKEVRQNFYALLGGQSPEIQSRCEIMGALFEGLSARALRNPALGELLDKQMLSRVLRHVLTG